MKRNYSNYFNDKIAIVTGSGDGLGRALCLKLAECGATVICTDKNINSAEGTLQLINSKTSNNSSQALHLDVTDIDQITSVFEKVETSFGRIDFLFNNAGISVSGEIRDLKPEHWKKVIDVNLFGMINCSTVAYRQMIKIKQGHIINIASISGFLDYTALSTPYAVSKHGAVTFSKALRLEALDFNVKVTTVCPGFIQTSIGKNMEQINTKDEMKKHLIELIEKGVPSEIASEKILKATALNRRILIFPLIFKYYYRFNCLFRFINRNLTIRMIRDFRKNGRLE